MNILVKNLQGKVKAIHAYSGPGRVVSFQIFSNMYIFTRLLCTFVKLLLLQVSEIFSFTRDDLMTEYIFIFNSHAEIFVCPG